MSRFLSFLAAAVLAAVLATPARAQQSVAPPGNSGVDEYLEVVPGAGGDRPAGGGGAGGGSGAQTPAKVLGAKTAAQLKALGKDGQAAAQAAAAGAPVTGGTAGSTAGGSAKGSTTGSKSGSGQSLGSDVKPGRSIAAANDGGRVHAIARAIAGDGGGMGLLFPLLLAGAVVAAIALVSARRLARR